MVVLRLPWAQDDRDSVKALATTSHYWNNCVVRQPLAVGERPVHWVGSSKRDFLAFPAGVKDDMGNALGIAQFGGMAPPAKPWKGLGAGVLELVESREGNAYRAVYTVRFQEAVYVNDQSTPLDSLSSTTPPDVR
jgi:phage-related protein